MSLKITVKSQEKTEIPLDNIKPGTVFRYGNSGPMALKLKYNKVLLLTYSNGDSWFDLNDNSFNNGIIILGYLDEIIVAGKE